MIALAQITPKNVAAFKTTRLAALKDTPMAFGSTYAKESPLTDEQWLKRAHDWSGERSIGYLAMDGENACGIVGAFVDEQSPHIAHVISMWVSPSHRRGGVGKSLIGAVEKWATGRGLSAVRLSATSSNLAAIQFYERIGYTRTGKTYPYPNDPALFEHEMIRMISQTAQSLQLGAIDQIGLSCTDLDEAQRFYCGLLGLRHVFDALPKMKFFGADGINIIMFKSDTIAPNSCIYFRVPGEEGLLEKKLEMLRAAGAKVEGNAHIIAHNWNGANVWMGFFRDPFGNLLALKSDVPVK